MKTYRSNQFHYEIQVPDGWPLPRQLDETTLRFKLTEEDLYTIQTGARDGPEPLDETAYLFKKEVRKLGYAHVEIGSIVVASKTHFTARYLYQGLWVKKYLLGFGRRLFAITATCANPTTLAVREPAWDEMARTLQCVPAFVEYYDLASQRWSGPPTTLRLKRAVLGHDGEIPHLNLIYAWGDKTARREAGDPPGAGSQLGPAPEAQPPDPREEWACQRAIAYLASLLYDVSQAAGLGCQSLPGQRSAPPRWQVEGLSRPIGLAETRIDYPAGRLEVNFCIEDPAGLERSPVLTLERLKAGFEVMFAEIRV